MKTNKTPLAVALTVLSLGAITASAQTLSRQECETNIAKEIANMAAGVAAGPYAATWESLKAHNEAPEWFRDAKIGIYFHLNFLAYYFNQAKQWGRDVMVTTKKLQYPQEVSVLDVEKGSAKPKGKKGTPKKN